MPKRTKILDKDQLQQKVNRLAWQIYEINHMESEIVVVGIQKRGVELAKRISKVIISISEIKVIEATVLCKVAVVVAPLHDALCRVALVVVGLRPFRDLFLDCHVYASYA